MGLEDRAKFYADLFVNVQEDKPKTKKGIDIAVKNAEKIAQRTAEVRLKTDEKIREKTAVLGKQLETKLMAEAGKIQLRSQQRNTDRLARQAEKQAEKEAMLAQKTKILTPLSKKFGITTFETEKALRSQGVTIDKDKGLIDNLGQKIKKVNSVMEKGIKVTKRFDYEYLSVMFMGMQIQRVFGGVVSSIGDMIGISDIFQMMAFDALIDPMFFLSDILWDISDAFSDMSPETKKFVGGIMLGTTFIGGLMAALGGVGLFLSGMKGWKAGTELSAWFDAGGTFWKLAEKVAKGFETVKLGIELVSDVITFDSTQFWASMGGILKNAGLLGVLYGKPVVGIASAAIGLGFEVIKDIKNKESVPDIIDGILDTVASLLTVYGISKWKTPTGKICMIVGIGWELTDLFKPPTSATEDKINAQVNKLKQEAQNKTETPKVEEKPKTLNDALIQAKMNSLGVKTIENASVSQLNSIQNTVKTFSTINKVLSTATGAVLGAFALPAGLGTAATVGAAVSLGTSKLLSYTEQKGLAAGNYLRSIFGMEGSKQFGGQIEKGGMYKLHAGETVIPSEGSAGNVVNVYINASLNSSYDTQKLASDISKYMRQEMERASGTRRI